MENADSTNAAAMAAYMKGNFPFVGIKTGLRRDVQKEILLKHKKEIQAEARTVALQLYNLPQREYHYYAIEILIKELHKKFVPNDIDLIEHMLITHSWWDSVDTIAKYLLGGYLKQYPESITTVIEKFSGSENMWLNRSAIIFQLGYKKDTNAKLLFSLCEKHRLSKEFFIQKAIGWALREYGKTNPEAVKNFVNIAQLKPLSTREALKNL
ncbi:DNA alkylation repair protein [Flavobacterium psychrotrophum]|uniref:DNA alkylation repair protein n=1 Tax=Flavobacterium psychrotrophum TaxID=2294119 RepID=UPI0013C3F63F|nr:DNA alkylation repair protein [Flavobacterium psychrotrophum]